MTTCTPARVANDHLTVQQPAQPNSPYSVVVLGRLAPIIIWLKLRLCLRDIHGHILDIDLKIPPRPPGYAFVEDPRDADDAIYGRDGYNFDGYRLRVELAHGGRGQSYSYDRPRSYSSGRRGVMVTGLPSSASWQDLKDHTRRAGDVCFSDVYREAGATVGIVDYTNYDDMKYAIRKLDDTEFRNAFSRHISV